jgi:hemolysin activation/secretion protein
MNAFAKSIASFLTFLFFLSGSVGAVTAQNAPTSRIQRSEQLIRQERALRKDLDDTGKVYVNKVVIQGPELAGQELQELAAPFKNSWLSPQDIATLKGAIRDTYIKNGYEEAKLSITHEVSKSILNIKIDVTD